MDRIDILIENVKRIEKRINYSISTWFTVKEATFYIKASERTIRRWIAIGILKSYKMPSGGQRIHRKDLDSMTMYGKPFNKLISDHKKVINRLTRDQ